MTPGRGPRLLGAILAGGRSSRFGSDKARAVWRGRTLLDWAHANLAPHVDEIIVCGRMAGIADRPEGGLGPLAGLNAALHYGREHSFDFVLTVPCDTPSLDAGLLRALYHRDGPAYAESIPVIGLWRCMDADALDKHLMGDDRSMRGWVREVGACAVAWPSTPPNINRPEDLADLPFA